MPPEAGYDEEVDPGRPGSQMASSLSPGMWVLHYATTLCPSACLSSAGERSASASFLQSAVKTIMELKLMLFFSILGVHSMHSRIIFR